MAEYRFKRKTFDNSTRTLRARDMRGVSAALDFPSVAAGATATLTVTVPGAAVGDDARVSFLAAPQAGLIFTAWVSDADEVTVRAENVTAGAVDAASATYRVVVWQV